MTATIGAVARAVTEGTEAAFTVRLDKAAKDAVAVTVSDTGAVLSGRAMSVRLSALRRLSLDGLPLDLRGRADSPASAADQVGGATCRQVTGGSRSPAHRLGSIPARHRVPGGVGAGAAL